MGFWPIRVHSGFYLFYNLIIMEYVKICKQVFWGDFQNVLVVKKNIDRFHCHAIKKINRKLSSGYSQEIVILLEINKQDTSPSFRSVRFPKPQIFVEMFRRNLQSSVWKRHVGAHQMCTNIDNGEFCNKLLLQMLHKISQKLILHIIQTTDLAVN